jgi:hypothetical protein
MKSIERAHIVVVAGGERGEALAAQLRRMGVAQVTTVGDVEEARRLCGQGGASLCLVTYTEAVLDAAQPVTGFAPGQDSGTPSLMLVDTITPYSSRIARHAGYRGAVHAKLAPQMLYRRIGAALQHRRAWPRQPQAFAFRLDRQMPAKIVEFRRPTLH